MQDPAADLIRRFARKFSMTPAARLSAAIEIHRQHRHPARACAAGAEGVGHRAPLCRLRRPRGDCGPGLGRAATARFERLPDGCRHAAGAPARHAQARARHGADAIAALCDGGRFAPAPLERSRARGADIAFARRRAGACCRRLSGMARCASRVRVRRGPRGGSDRDGKPRAARSARQHAEGQAREGGRFAEASRC